MALSRLVIAKKMRSAGSHRSIVVPVGSVKM